jgi:hypothetical protein
VSARRPLACEAPCNRRRRPPKLPMATAFALGLASIGLFLWSAFLGALITNEGETFETPALLV